MSREKVLSQAGNEAIASFPGKIGTVNWKHIPGKEAVASFPACILAVKNQFAKLQNKEREDGMTFHHRGVWFLAALTLAWFLPSLCAAESPFHVTDIITHEKTNYGSRVGGDFLIKKDGSILYVYTEENRYPDFIAFESKDQGKTWSEPKLFMKGVQTPEKGAYLCPSFLRLPDDQIVMSYLYVLRGTPLYGYSFYRRSADDGKTWTEPFCVTPFPGYCLMHNDRLLQLSSGRIVAIVSIKMENLGKQSTDHSNYSGSLFYSDDQGYRWQHNKNFITCKNKKIEIQEPDVVELKDGRLMMFARSYSGHPVKAFSGDQGLTWGEAELMQELPMPHASYPTVKRIPSTGDLLFIWASRVTRRNDGKGPMGRSCLSAVISKDEGKTFGPMRHLLDDPEEDFGYQSVEFVGDNGVLISSHCRTGMKIVETTVDWFYEKE